MSIRLRWRQYALLVAASAFSFLLGSYLTAHISLRAPQLNNDGLTGLSDEEQQSLVHFRARSLAPLPAALTATPSHPTPTPSLDHGIRKEQEAAVEQESRCTKQFGKVGILVIYTNASQYTHATDVLWCYAISRGYPFFLIQPYEDALSVQHCSHIQEVMFRKHCVAAAYLSKVDWLYVLDADTSVINAQHCLEDFIDPEAAAYLSKVDWLYVLDADTSVINAQHCLEDFIDPEAELVFYERYFSGEIMSGNYIAKATDPARTFLRQWAQIESEQPPMPYFFSADNGAIHLQVLRVLYPDNEALIQKCFALVRLSEWPDWEPGYGAFVRCVKRGILAWKRSKVGKQKPSVRLRIQPRAQSFCRDVYDTWYQWYKGDFLAHSVKTEEPFDLAMTQRLTLLWDGETPPECLDPAWRPELDPNVAKRVDERWLRESLRVVGEEFSKQKLQPLFANPTFEKCWPHCPDVVRTFKSKSDRIKNIKKRLHF